MTTARPPARVLDGSAVADEIHDALRPRIECAGLRGRPPTLGLLLAGRAPGSEVYVRNKMRRSEELGISNRA